MTIPRIEHFTVEHESDGAWLRCPLVGCPHPSLPLETPIDIEDISEAADQHIRNRHLPKLPETHVYCGGCYNAIPNHRSFGRLCGDCAA